MDFKWQSQYGDVVRIRAALGVSDILLVTCPFLTVFSCRKIVSWFPTPRRSNIYITPADTDLSNHQVAKSSDDWLQGREFSSSKVCHQSLRNLHANLSGFMKVMTIRGIARFSYRVSEDLKQSFMFRYFLRMLGR